MLTLGRNRSGQIGFFKYNGKEIPPYRAYLTRNNVTEGPTTLMVKIGHDFDCIDEIVENHHSDNKNIYNLAGQRVNQATHGLYIIAGKKVLVK